jgi:hypothetical protein
MGGWEISAAELRSGGEWELLLAEALTISCLNSDHWDNECQADESVDDEIFTPESRSEMINAQMWRNIYLSATSHLMPAVALLRLGMGKVGRKPHPFSFHDNSQDPYDVAPLHFSERLAGTPYVSLSLAALINETLAVLARLCVEAEDSLTSTCYAIASHLVVDTKSFSDMEGIYSMRCAFTAFKRIREVAESSPKKDVKSVIPFLVDRMMHVVKKFSDENDKETAAKEFRRLNFFLGGTVLCQVDTVVGNSVDVFKILKLGMKELNDETVETYTWHDKDRQKMTIRDLVSLLCEDCLRATDKTRSLVTLMLSRVAFPETRSTINSSSIACDPLVIPSIIEAFNGVDKKKLKAVVLKDLPCLRGNSSLPPAGLNKELANLLSLLLYAREGPPYFERAKFVHDTLMMTFDSWKKINPVAKTHILSVLFAYATRFGSLLEVGSKLVENASEAKIPGEAEFISIFLASVRDLRAALQRVEIPVAAEVNIISHDKKKRNRRVEANGGVETPKSCSFIQKSGFHGQHWYHCKYLECFYCFSLNQSIQLSNVLFV